MADVWSSGRQQAVFHKLGTHANGAERFRRATFDILHWDSDGTGGEEHYICVPAASAAPAQIDGTEINEAGNQYEIGTFFGFYERESVVVDPDGFGNTESWLGLHSFGYY